MKISRKLILFFLITSLIPILFFGFLGYNQAKQDLEKAYASKLSVIANLKVEDIKKFFNEKINSIKVAQDYYNIKTNLPIITKFFDNKNNREYINTKDTLDAQLKTFQSIYEYQSVELLNPDGIIVYSTNDLDAEKKLGKFLNDTTGTAFSEGTKDINISEIYRDLLNTNKYLITITAPIHDFKNNFIGVIALNIDMSPFFNFIQDKTNLGETGETLIGTKVINKKGNKYFTDSNIADGKDYALFLNTLRNDTNASLNKKILFGDTYGIPIQEAVNGKNGAGTVLDYKNKTVLAEWRYIPLLDWEFVSKIDIDEVYLPIYKLRDTYIITGLLIALLTSIFGLFISKSISNPITILTKKTEDISSGNLNTEINIINQKNEIGSLSKSFKIMADSLKLREKNKYEFIKNVSHQLRTPVSSINFQLEILNEKTKKDPKYKKFHSEINEIMEANQSTSAIMDDMLKYIELGDTYTASNKTDIDIKSMITSILESYNDIIKHKKLIIKTNLPDNLTIKADESAIKTVFINLIDNAITYSNKDGKILISTRKNANNIYFEIKDFGIGIPKIEQIHVFDQFYRARNSYLKKSVGTGLGLTISRIIIKGHGGKIGFKSVENEGSTFFFTV